MEKFNGARKTWQETLQEDLKDKGITEWINKSKNRISWTKLIKMQWAWRSVINNSLLLIKLTL